MTPTEPKQIGLRESVIHSFAVFFVALVIIFLIMFIADAMSFGVALRSQSVFEFKGGIESPTMRLAMLWFALAAAGIEFGFSLNGHPNYRHGTRIGFAVAITMCGLAMIPGEGAWLDKAAGVFVSVFLLAIIAFVCGGIVSGFGLKGTGELWQAEQSDKFMLRTIESIRGRQHPLRSVFLEQWQWDPNQGKESVETLRQAWGSSLVMGAGLTNHLPGEQFAEDEVLWYATDDLVLTNRNAWLSEHKESNGSMADWHKHHFLLHDVASIEADKSSPLLMLTTRSGERYSTRMRKPEAALNNAMFARLLSA